MSKGKTTKKPKTTPSGKLSPIEIAEISGRAAECITEIIHTIGEERRKTEDAKTERQRISAEMEAQISKAENETARLLGQLHSAAANGRWCGDQRPPCGLKTAG